MNFKKVLISELKPAAYNPRKNLSEKDPEYQRIKKSIETFGYVDPVIVNADYTVIGGHQRLKVLKGMGEASIDVVVVDLPKDQEKALNVALNKITGDWDLQQLSIVLSELKEEDFDISITGFSEEELKGIDEELFGKAKQEFDTEPQISRAEELRKEWGTELGQMWQCGDHRVICGDCTDPAVVERVMEGEKAGCVVTDPPYAVFGSSTGIGENITDDKMIQPFCRAVYQMAVDATDNNTHIYIHCDWKSFNAWWGQLSRFDLKPLNCIVWDKGDGGLGTNYTNRHEFILFLNRTPKQTKMTSSPKGLKQVHGIANVQRFNVLQNNDRLHNAGKPIPLESVFISASTVKGESVIDFFLGSGTTMIACENLGRKCRGCEIDPGYVAVILQRYKDTFPGKEIKLIE